MNADFMKKKLSTRKIKKKKNIGLNYNVQTLRV